MEQHHHPEATQPTPSLASTVAVQAAASSPTAAPAQEGSAYDETKGRQT